MFDDSHNFEELSQKETNVIGGRLGAIFSRDSQKKDTQNVTFQYTPQSVKPIENQPQPDTPQVISACFIQFESSENAKPLGLKGIAILASKTSSSLLIYEPSNKQAVLTFPLHPYLPFTLQPDLYIQFPDQNKIFWSIRFQNQDDLTTFCRFLCLAKSVFQPSTLVTQDLACGAYNLVPVSVGDQVKISYSFYLLHSNHPQGLGSLLMSSEKPISITIGQNKEFSGIEQSLIGMRKGGVRMAYIPSALYDNQKNIIAEISVVKVKFNKSKEEKDTVSVIPTTTPSNMPSMSISQSPPVSVSNSDVPSIQSRIRALSTGTSEILADPSIVARMAKISQMQGYNSLIPSPSLPVPPQTTSQQSTEVGTIPISEEQDDPFTTNTNVPPSSTTQSQPSISSLTSTPISPTNIAFVHPTHTQSNLNPSLSTPTNVLPPSSITSSSPNLQTNDPSLLSFLRTEVSSIHLFHETKQAALDMKESIKTISNTLKTLEEHFHPWLQNIDTFSCKPLELLSTLSQLISCYQHTQSEESNLQKQVTSLQNEVYLLQEKNHKNLIENSRLLEDNIKLRSESHSTTVQTQITNLSSEVQHLTQDLSFQQKDNEKKQQTIQTLQEETSLSEQNNQQWKNQIIEDQKKAIQEQELFNSEKSSLNIQIEQLKAQVQNQISTPDPHSISPEELQKKEEEILDLKRQHQEQIDILTQKTNSLQNEIIDMQEKHQKEIKSIELTKKELTSFYTQENIQLSQTLKDKDVYYETQIQDLKKQQTQLIDQAKQKIQHLSDHIEEQDKEIEEEANRTNKEISDAFIYLFGQIKNSFVDEQYETEKIISNFRNLIRAVLQKMDISFNISSFESPANHSNNDIIVDSNTMIDNKSIESNNHIPTISSDSNTPICETNPKNPNQTIPSPLPSISDTSTKANVIEHLEIDNSASLFDD